jgi:hypothetical protein
MNAKQEDKLSMEIVVVDLLNKTAPEILAQMPQINTLITNFSNNVAKIRSYQSYQTLNKTGYRMSKDKLREKMTKKGFEIAARVCAYATSINNKVLEKEVTFAYSDMKKLRSSTIANTCQSIHDIAIDHIANLQEYGVTNTTISDLKDSIIQYNAMLPKTRAAIVTRTSFTTRIVELFKENDKILYRIDKLVTMLKFQEANFYKAYFNSKKIIESGHRKLSLRGNITDEQGQPIEQVTITIETPINQTTKSTEIGNYQFKKAPGGIFPVTFTRDGFTPERVYLVFTPNARLDFNITLKRINQQQNSA